MSPKNNLKKIGDEYIAKIKDTSDVIPIIPIGVQKAIFFPIFLKLIEFDSAGCILKYYNI